MTKNEIPTAHPKSHRLFGGKSAGCVAASFDNEDDMHRFLGDPISIVDIDFRTLYLDW